MQSHRFACGERVLYTERRFPNLSWKEPFIVVDLLPSDDLEPRYRIRSMDRITEYVVGESALGLLPPAETGQRRLDGRFAALGA